MDMATIEALNSFLEAELPRVREEILLLKQRSAFPDYVLKGRPDPARRIFIDTVHIIGPQLSQCTTVDEIWDVCIDNLQPIRDIGIETIKKFVYHYAYTNDIDPEASNTLCFLNSEALTYLEKEGFINNGRLSLGEVQALFSELSQYEILTFFNRHISK